MSLISQEGLSFSSVLDLKKIYPMVNVFFDWSCYLCEVSEPYNTGRMTAPILPQYFYKTIFIGYLLRIH